MTPVRLRELFAWARTAGWRPKFPRNRRDGVFSWVNRPRDPVTRRWPVGATAVTVDGWYDGSSGARVAVSRMTQVGWVCDAQFVTGAGQVAVDVLAGLHLVPRRFTTAYHDGLRAARR